MIVPRAAWLPTAIYCCWCCLLAAAVPLAAALAGEESQRMQLPPSDAVGAVYVTGLQSLVESRQATPFLFKDYRNFSKIAVVPMREPEFIYVAAQNHIIKVGLKTLEEEDKIEWSTKQESTALHSKCQLHGLTKEQCPENNIFALQATTDFKLLVCGSVVGTPTCSLRSAMQPKNSFGSYNIQLRDSDMLSEKVIAMDDKQVFVGAFLRSGRADPAIYRSSLVPSGDAIRTNQDIQLSMGMKSIYQPAKFISVHIVGEYVYYFFQENSEEMSTCGAKAQKTVSRVARVCKSDPGHHQLWLSYSKSRLACSEGGNWVKPQEEMLRDTEPFYYDLLQDTFVTDSTVYGVFTATSRGIRASAICGFPFTTFNQVFGDLTVKVKRWDSRDESGAPVSFFVEAKDQYNKSDCKSLLALRDDIGEYERSHRRQHFLKPQWVVQDTNDPLAMAPENWLRLVVDRLPTGSPNTWHAVAFVLTDRHSVKKVLLTEGNRCVLEEMTLDKQLDGKINDMKLLPSGYLIVSTDSRLIRLPTSRCDRHATRDACLGSRDPYCGWNLRTVSCTVRPANTDQWEQEVNPTLGRVCPRFPTAAAADAAGAPTRVWSAWLRCRGNRTHGAAAGKRTRGGKKDQEQKREEEEDEEEFSCACRHRVCSGRGAGASACVGGAKLEYQVANCSRNGAWGEWGHWSPCAISETAAGGACVGRQDRSRRCDSPEPAFGGKTCAGGGESEERACVPAECQAARSAAASSSVSGSWTAWSDWGTCDRRCGAGGAQERTRRCQRTDASDAVGGAGCHGDSWQRRLCSNGACPEIASHAEPTSWIRSGAQTQAGRTRWIAFGATCFLRESGTRHEWLEIRLTNTSKLCDQEENRCTLEVLNGVSGADRSAADWSQWSCWSDCAVEDSAATGCLMGVMGRQRRRRVCVGRGHLPATAPDVACDRDAAGDSIGGGDGGSSEERSCRMPAMLACETYARWTTWSYCNPATGLESRTRSCLKTVGGATGCASIPSGSDAAEAADILQTRGCRQASAQAEVMLAVPASQAPPGPPLSSATSVVGGELLLSYPLVAVICLASVLATCLAFSFLVCCYYRRRLAIFRRRVRQLKLKLDQLQSGSGGVGGGGCGTILPGGNDLSGGSVLMVNHQLHQPDASSISDSCNNRSSQLTCLTNSGHENFFNKLSASANAGTGTGGKRVAAPPAPPRYLRSASATEPRQHHYTSLAGTSPYHHSQLTTQPPPRPSRQPPPPSPPPVCPLTVQLPPDMQIYSCGASSQGSFDAIRHLTKPPPPSRYLHGRPYIQDAAAGDEAALVESSETNPLLLHPLFDYQHHQLSVQPPRRVSCSSQTDCSSLRRPSRAAGAAAVAQPPATHRQLSDSAATGNPGQV